MNGTTGTHKIGIGWQVGTPSGWGTYGYNLALELARRGIMPDLRFLARDLALQGEAVQLLRSALNHRPDFSDTPAYPYLHALGEGLNLPPETAHIRGTPDIGVVFFESRAIPPENVRMAQERLGLIVTGSTWNTQVLQELGLTHVRFCPQGIDPVLFHPPAVPMARPAALHKRFVVFSGGKLEYRKGQDLVVAAFRRFQESHPDAVLLTAWQNMWQAGLSLMQDSAYVDGIPARMSGGQLDMAEWFSRNGIGHAAFDVGLTPNARMPDILACCDAAVFTSRCEGGTNLAAMEAMACGVPTILSANTGHHDLLWQKDGVPTAVALERQMDIGLAVGAEHLRDWGESDVAEIVSALEGLYADRERAARIGATGAAFLSEWSWTAQISRLLEALPCDPQGVPSGP